MSLAAVSFNCFRSGIQQVCPEGPLIGCLPGGDSVKLWGPLSNAVCQCRLLLGRKTRLEGEEWSSVVPQDDCNRADIRLPCTTSLPWRLRRECEGATPSLLHAKRCRPRHPTRGAARHATAPAHGRRLGCTPVRPRVWEVTSATPGARREHRAHTERSACLTCRALPGRPHVRMSRSTRRRAQELGHPYGPLHGWMALRLLVSHNTTRHEQ